MAKFEKLLKKLAFLPESDEYVTDKYDERAMNEDISGYSKALSPEDIEKIHYTESTGGKFLKNPTSSASGHYQLVDSTRKIAEDLAKEQGIYDEGASELQKEANLMKSLVKKYENTLENAQNGPYDPNLENIYLMHKNGIQGGLNALNDPNSPKSKEKFKEVNKLLSRKPKKDIEQTLPAKNLLDLLRD